MTDGPNDYFMLSHPATYTSQPCELDVAKNLCLDAAECCYLAGNEVEAAQWDMALFHLAVAMQHIARVKNRCEVEQKK